MEVRAVPCQAQGTWQRVTLKVRTKYQPKNLAVSINGGGRRASLGEVFRERMIFGHSLKISRRTGADPLTEDRNDDNRRQESRMLNVESPGTLREALRMIARR